MGRPESNGARRPHAPDGEAGRRLRSPRAPDDLHHDGRHKPNGVCRGQGEVALLPTVVAVFRHLGQEAMAQAKKPPAEEAAPAAASDFEFSMVENTHKIITRIHELAFERKKCDAQLPLTRSIGLPGEGETEEVMATKRSVGSLGDKDLRGKKVFLRADLNVLLDDGQNITGDNRIRVIHHIS